MKAALAVEIVSALVALVCLISLIVSLVQSRKRAGRNASSRHRVMGMVLCAAAAVHGVAAMVYASGALLATYLLGWVAVACFFASGISMVPAARKRLGSSARAWHVRLFVAGIVFVIAHIVAGRL